ncbi:uncharacterized protein ISCGN_029768 [Ixodes scapularis]
MIKRITRKNRGVREEHLRRILEALVYSRTLYQLPHIRLTKTQTSKLETILRRGHRLALGIPRFSANYRIEATGTFNTLEERCDIQRQSQHDRLLTSKQGRQILRQQGYLTPPPEEIPDIPPPREYIPRLTVLPIPRNMDNERYATRRAARINRLRTSPIPAHVTLYYTDASHKEEMSITSVSSDYLNWQNNHVEIPTPEEAEITAIGEAITLPYHPTEDILIRTDSQAACRAFRDNTLPSHIRQHIQDYLHLRRNITVTIQWTPGHDGLEGNEEAHLLTREPLPGPPAIWPPEYNPRTERAICRTTRKFTLKQLNENVRTLPPPQRSLGRKEEVLLRRAQTLSLLTDSFFHYISRSAGHPTCKHCGGYPDNHHTLWACPNAQSSKRTASSCISPTLRPSSYEEWLRPPKHLVTVYQDTLLQHIITTLPEEES